MQEVLAVATISRPGVEGRSQPLRRLRPRELDHRSCSAHERDAVDVAAVDQRHFEGGVHLDASAFDVASAWHGEMKRSGESETIEAIQGRGRRARGPARFTDVEHHGDELGTSRACREGRTERSHSGSVEEAALDSATKLAIGQTSGVGLGLRERSQLTCRARRDATISIGHGTDSTPAVSHPRRRSRGQRPLRPAVAVCVTEHDIRTSPFVTQTALGVGRAGGDGSLGGPRGGRGEGT